MFLYLANAIIQTSIISHDPWYFLWILANTIWSRQGFLIQSTIGILGWLDMPLPPIIYYGFSVLFGMVVIRTVEKLRKQMPFEQLLLITGICFGTIACIAFHFYIYGTPVASSMIDSLQGRYFLPILPFIILVVSNWAQIALRNKKITFILFGSLFLALLIQGIFFRYYDYSRVFDTADLLLSQEKDLQNKGEHTSIVIEDTRTFTYEVKYPQYKIGGFQLLVDVDETQPVNVPYRYELRDAHCTTVIRRGYLDQTELHRLHIYTQLLPITPLPEDRICLVFTPLFGMKKMQYLPLVTEGEKPVVNFLYIKK